MPSLRIEELNTILKYFNKTTKDYPNFVETGTYIGETIMEMQKYFKKLYTIELSKNLFDLSFQKFRDFENIQNYLGDSVCILPIICSSLEEQTIFWLDAHYCLWGSEKGDIEVPLLEELKEIKNNYKLPGLIIIDDYRLFDNGDEYVDWSNITMENVLDSIGEYKEYAIFGDRFVLLI